VATITIAYPQNKILDLNQEKHTKKIGGSYNYAKTIKRGTIYYAVLTS